MDNTKTLYIGKILIQHNKDLSCCDFHTPIITESVRFFTNLPQRNKAFMQFSFHYPLLQKRDHVLFQLDQATYGDDERAFLFSITQIVPCDYIIKGFFIYTRDPVYDSLAFDFVVRYKHILPESMTINTILHETTY